MGRAAALRITPSAGRGYPPRVRRPPALAPSLLLALAGLALPLAACAPTPESTGASSGSSSASGSSAAPASCDAEDLETLEPGTLTVATSEPAYSPWVLDDDPTSGEGYESAVAYAVAEQLGYAEDQVTWVRADFNAAIAPGPKTFDVDVNQFSIDAQRAEAVDFSSPYYDVVQAVVATASSPAASAASIADLKGLRLGAQVGTTSLTSITDQIEPETQPLVYNSNDDAVAALENGQVDALVLDLPSAFYASGAQLDDGTVVGQLPNPSGAQPEQFGMVLELGSPLTPCVSQAVDAVRADGTLAELQEEWLSQAADAPVLT